MNRKERLKLTQTPEKGFIYADESFYLPSPQPKAFYNKIEEDVLPFRVEDGPTWKDLIKKYLVYGHILFPYLLILYFCTLRKGDIAPLKEHVYNLRTEPIKSKIYNIARIELGTTVTVEEGLYKYGLYGFRISNDPNVILNDSFLPGDCLAIVKDKGNIKIRFRRKMRIHKIAILHPMTGSRNSAIKDFEFIGEGLVGKFTYDLSKDVYQCFKFESFYSSSITIRVLNNHGCKQYTTLYKIFVFGNV